MSEALLMLDKLEQILIDVARNCDTITYLKLAQRLGLQPPHTIHQAAELVETLMRLHAETGTPQLASVVISRSRGGLPAPGYFILLSELGLYSGSVDGEDAREFHAQEKQRLQSELRRKTAL